MVYQHVRPSYFLCLEKGHPPPGYQHVELE